MNSSLPVGILLAAVLSACAQSQSKPVAASGKEEHLTDYQLRVREENAALDRETDTTYKRRMQHLLDVSDRIPIDSLARLHALVLRTPSADLWRLRQAIGCEGFRLAMKYGTFPYTRAMDRMTDSLMQRGLDAEQITKRYLSAPGPDMSVGRATCGDEAFKLPILPDSLSSKPYPKRFQVPPKP